MCHRHSVHHKSHKDFTLDQTRASGVKGQQVNRLCLNHATAEIIRIKTRLSINTKSVLPITTHYRHVKPSQTTTAIALHFLVADRAGQVVAPFGGKLWRAARQADPPSLAHPRIPVRPAIPCRHHAILQVCERMLLRGTSLAEKYEPRLHLSYDSHCSGYDKR
jgi:hypothetical protein